MDVISNSEPLSEERFWQEIYISGIRAGDGALSASGNADYALRQLKLMREYENEPQKTTQ